MPRKSRKSQDQQQQRPREQQQPDTRQDEKEQQQTPNAPELNPGRAPDVSRDPGEAGEER